MHRFYNNNHPDNNYDYHRTQRSRRYQTRSHSGYGYVQAYAMPSVVEIPPNDLPPPYEEFERDCVHAMPPAAIYQPPVESRQPLAAPRSNKLRLKPSQWSLQSEPSSSRGPYGQERGWQSAMDLVLRPAPVGKAMNQTAAICDRTYSAVQEFVRSGFDRQETSYIEAGTKRNMDLPVAGNSSYRLKEGITINDFKKTWRYANSRLPPHVPPSKLYLPTWQLICVAAQASLDVYDRPRKHERRDYIEADWRQGTKAMCIKSRPVDDKNLVVIAIRGSQWNPVDWAVNFRRAPTEPIGFLDDPGNACHAGFLQVARSMIAPVAARLREIIQQNPSRASSSLVITGHSAGGAVASLLYMHMMSSTIVSDLTALTGIFDRVHCVVFGTPPLSFLPLQNPEHSSSHNLFMHFVNEGDLVVRADKEYLGTLARIITEPAPVEEAGGHHRKPRTLRQQASRQTLRATSMVVNKVIPPKFEVPEATLSTAGRVILLRESPRDRSTEAVQVTDHDLRKLVFGDLEMHSMLLYKSRVDELATAAMLGKEVG